MKSSSFKVQRSLLWLESAYSTSLSGERSASAKTPSCNEKLGTNLPSEVLLISICRILPRPPQLRGVGAHHRCPCMGMGW